MAQEILTPASSSPWTCPAHVLSVIVECWGGGGGGSTNSNGGGGGGGGGYSKKTVSVTPGSTYAFAVGSGGAAGGAATNGGDTNWNTSEVLAKGGVHASSASLGAGGASGSGVGTTLFSGGSGANGGGAGSGGGGGSSGGTASNGGGGAVTAGGTVTGGGSGGNGGVSGSTAGTAGSIPGGGGGGGGGIGGGGSFAAAGAGANGKILLSYDFEPSISDAISLTEQAVGGNVYTRSLSDTITFSEATVRAREFDKSVSDTITFEEVQFTNRIHIDLDDSEHAFFNDPGLHQFTVPAGVTAIIAECWGAGGGATGLLKDIANNIFQGGYGGGGGGYGRKTFVVQPGDVYDVYVGIGGAGNIDNDGSTGATIGFDTDGQDGEDSSFGNNSDCVGLGGKGGHFEAEPIGFGAYAAAGNGGAGGTGVGLVTFNGGSGGDALSSTQPAGGGGAAGNTQNGGAGTTTTGGGGGVAHGGQGGSPGTLAVPEGTNGEQPGGGGGGSRTANYAQQGAYGGHGKVIISYAIQRVEDPIVLAENASSTAVRPVSASESLAFIETAIDIDVFTLSVSDTIVFTEVAPKIATQTRSETITFTETALGVSSHPVSDSLSLVEFATIVGSTFNLAIHETLSFTEDTSRHIFVVCIDKFSPSPSLGIRTTTSLYYPYTSPTNTANLRNPKYGNIMRLETGRISRKTRGGRQRAGRSSTWLNLYSLQLEFVQLTEAQATALIALLVACAGDEIKLVDWENRTWRCIVISEPNDITQNKDDGCQYSASLKLQGVLV